MFSRRVFGGTPDTFKVTLEYGPSHHEYQHAPTAQVRLPKALATLEFEFTSDEAEATVVERFAQRTSILALEKMEERVMLNISTDAIANAASFPEPQLSVRMSVACSYPTLRCILMDRSTNTGTASESIVTALLKHCDLHGVWKVKGAEGFGNFWATCTAVEEWQSMRNLNLSYCMLSSMPPAIGSLQTLKILRLSHNKLTSLPPDIQKLSHLEVLALDHNLLTAIPVELKHCSGLRELNLEGNKLTTPVIDLRSLVNLQSLQLFGNPLEFLPELSPCTALRSLSLANVRIMSDATYTRWEVEVSNLSYMSRGHKLAPLFRLTFRRSSLQHPMLAGALGRIAEDRSNCELIAKEEGAIQQLVLMALSENQIVVKQACKTIGHLSTFNSSIAKRLITHDVLSAIVTLMKSSNQESQLCGLNVLASLATNSDRVSAHLLTDSMLARLQQLIQTGDPGVRQAALHSLSNLCFCRDNKVMVRKHEGLLQLVVDLAQPHGSHGTSDLSRLMALRVLAVLGENERVRLALQQPPVQGRGIRILAMDGGGMKGLAMVQMLRHLEQHTGQPICNLFDLICGTSTGAILAVALGKLSYTLDMCEDIYTKLGQKVFSQSQATSSSKEEQSWRDSWYRMYKSSSQHMRVAVYGCKHDASTFEALLKEMCNMVEKYNCISEQLIDAASIGGPKVCVVATLASVSPATPYVFRTYELPMEAEALADRLRACPGSSKHLVWQSIRASSAAPYYLDDFVCGDERFQDGAATANNPALIAIQQAQLLWPDTPVECVVSLGTGTPPIKPRERSVSTYLDTGNVLIESACSTERVHEALSTLVHMLPGVKYYRFQPVDERCNMELDDVDPASWAKLQAAAEEYCLAHTAHFDEAAALLTRSATHLDATSSESLPPNAALRLGKHRGLMVLEAPTGISITGTTLVEQVADAIARNPNTVRRTNISCCGGGSSASRMHSGAGAARSAQPYDGPATAATTTATATPTTTSSRSSSTTDLMLQPGPSGGSAAALPQPLLQGHGFNGTSAGEQPPGTAWSTGALAAMQQNSFFLRSAADSISARSSLNLGAPAEASTGPNMPSAATQQREAASASASGNSLTLGHTTTAGSVDASRRSSCSEPGSIAMASDAAAAAAASAAAAGTGRSPLDGPAHSQSSGAIGLRSSQDGPIQGRTSTSSSSFLNFFLPTSWAAPSTPFSESTAATAAADGTAAATAWGGGAAAAPSVDGGIPTAASEAWASGHQPYAPNPPPLVLSQEPSLALPAGIGAGETAAAAEVAAAASLRPQDLVQGLLQDLGETIGIVHLALSSTAAGLTVHWRHDVFAVVEPGPEASELVQHLGGDPATTTLSALCATNSNRFQVDDTILVKLSRHEVMIPTGHQVASFLFHRTRPLYHLTSKDIMAMGSVWSDLIITTTSVLPPAIVEALLKCGAKAVVAANMPLRDKDATAVARLFQCLLQDLYNGNSVVDALQTTEAQHPDVEGLFACYHL